jgi:DNA polymerase I-like protein with 3'-5' exonuclease and polymerase domains
VITTYEQYLVAKRDRTLPDRELKRLEGLKGISKEIAQAETLRDWIAENGGVQYATSEHELVEWLDTTVSDRIIGIDIETAKAPGFEDHPLAGLLPVATRIRTVQLWQEGLPALVVDCFHAGYDWLAKLDGVSMAAHNGLFERQHILHAAGLDLTTVRCTMQMLRPFVGRNLSLVNAMKKLAAESDEIPESWGVDALGITLSKALQVSDWGREQLLGEQLEYAAADAIAAARLHDVLVQELNHSDQCFRDCEAVLQKLTTVVLHQAPLHVNFEAHEALVEKWTQTHQEATETLQRYGLAEPSKVVARQKWLAEQLTDDRYMDWPRTDTGNLKTDKNVIAEHAAGSEPLEALATWSKSGALLSNFGQKLRDLSVDGKLYPGYRVGGMITGRFACTQPNLQNIPKEARSLFIAGPGYKLVTGDLSQIELRTAGIIADEPVIRKAYAEGQDLHTLMAANIAGVPLEQVTSDQRKMAKAANFGLLYGAGAKTLRAYAQASFRVAMSLEQAREIKETFHNTYPALTEWQQTIVSDTNAIGYSESLHFRLRRTYDFEPYTHSMNFPVQSSAAEILWLAMIYVHEHRPDPRVQIQLHVYDELCLVAPEELADTAARLLRDAFRHGFQTVFPGVSTDGLVGIGDGTTWAEAADDDSVKPEWSL